MMRVSFRRYLVVCLAVALSTAAGAFAGYSLARTFVLTHARSRVNGAADQATAELSASIAEARRALAAVNASTDAPCSDADLAELRELVFQAHYLKEAGRIRDGRIACSNTYGKSADAALLPEPAAIQPDGSRLYLNVLQFQVAGHGTVAVQMGGAFIVHNPFANGELASLQMQYVATAMDHSASRPGLTLGDSSLAQGLPLTQRADGIHNDEIFATRCATQGTSCITVFTPVGEILDSSFPLIGVLAAVGAAAGALFGVVISQVYLRKRSLAAQLMKAIREESLTIAYQPIVDLKSGRIVEAEALVRWNDERGNPISPEVFVPVAEEHGFVGDLTALVVRRVLAEMGRTLRENPEFRVHVNVAARDLADPKFLPMLREGLDQFNVRPQSLGIEITESFTARQQVAKDTIALLRERGHFVSIDDFGTGYSSLAYLHDLAVDAIKIDKAFTRAIGTDAVTVSILPQILSMAERLRLHVTVEGIETMDQARYFAEAPVPIRAQGWFYGRPAPWDMFLFRMETGPAMPVSALGHAGPVVVINQAH